MRGCTIFIPFALSPPSLPSLPPLSLGANIATYPARDSAQFVSNLKLALDEIHQVLESPEYSPQKNN